MLLTRLIFGLKSEFFHKIKNLPKIFESETIAISKKPIIKPVGAEDFFFSGPVAVLISPDCAGSKEESSGTTEYSILKPLECSTASSLVNLMISGS